MEVITMKLKEEEKNLIRKKSQKIGLSMASFCRSVILKDIREKENKEDII